MSLRATQWITVRRRGTVGPVYHAHPVGNGWRYCEKTDERFPEWQQMTEAEFWTLFEKVTEPVQRKRAD
jgi:hypothetical protein